MPLERVVLACADGMTIAGQDTSHGLFAEFRRGFSDAALVELTAHVAFENVWSRFNHALRIKSQDFCRLPVRERPASGP